MKTLDIFTDGGCRGNPGIGAWAFHIPGPRGFSNWGFKNLTTNNEMELRAVLEALKYCITLTYDDYDHIILHSDSQYVVDTFTKWVYNWINCNTLLMRGPGNPRPNGQLISDILLMRKVLQADEWSVKFVKVAGHADCLENIEADRLVNLSMDTEHSDTVIQLGPEHLKRVIGLLTPSIKVDISDDKSTAILSDPDPDAEQLCKIFNWHYEIKHCEIKHYE